jgi:RNA polymerase sigma-70 factor (ECF subfamily)
MSNSHATTTSGPKPTSVAFRTQLLAEIPHIRAFAASLCGSLSLADDLVQETLLKAWAHAGSFTMGTNIRAWLFTILRNTYYSHHRQYGREVPDTDGIYAAQVAVAGNQVAHMNLLDLRQALLALPLEQREALIMIGAMGMAYEEAAAICEVAEGTIKSRVSRGRLRLAEILGLQADTLPGPGANAALPPHLPAVR